jgi:hypothetical protein
VSSADGSDRNQSIPTRNRFAAFGNWLIDELSSKSFAPENVAYAIAASNLDVLESSSRARDEMVVVVG